VSTGTALRANPRALPGGLVGICSVLLVLGVLAFVVGLMSDPATTWRAFHVNFIYYATLSQGGLVLACALVIVGARWAGPVRHVAEGLGAWIPITFLLLGLDFLGREWIQTQWIHGAPHGKEAWLNVPRVYITDAVVLGIMAALSLSFLKTSFRPTLHGAAERATRACSNVGPPTGAVTRPSAPHPRGS
jgi:hypothetical protein